MKTLTCVVALFTMAVGCAASPPPAPASGSDPKAATAAPAVAKPDVAKATDHLKSHVKYPATRAQVVAACADTPEFSKGENKWFADNLPEGTYKSADEVVKALKL